MLHKSLPLARPKTSSVLRLLTSTVILGLAFEAKAENSVELPTVSVIENKEDESYNAQESSYYKINRPLVDTPRSTTTVTRQLMDDQGITKVADALRNVPGISLAAGEGGNQGDNLTIRGFSARSDFFVDGMRDFGNYFRDAFNLESVEVVQGPSSVLFGRGSTGGVVQQNSKQAFLGSKKEVGTMFGSNNLARLTADVNEKIGENSAFRINVMGQTNDVAERDAAQYQRAGIAPSLSFGLGTDTRLTLNYLHQNENNTPDYGIPFYAGKPASVDRKNFYGFEDSDHLRTNVDIATAKFEHDLNKDLTFRNQTRYARYTRDVQVTEPQATSSTSVKRNMKIRESLETYLGNQTDLTAKFSTFDIKHQAVVGLALETESSSPLVYTNTSSTTDLENPTQVNYNYSANTFSSLSSAKIDTVGVYALDSIKLNKSWELSLGTRFDNLRTSYNNLSSSYVETNSFRTDNVVSYNAGIVYKPAPNGSIYFNHGTSFNPSAEGLTLTNTSTTGTNNFNTKPEKNKLYEVGTKWDLFKKRLSTTLAVFRAEKENARETNPFGGSNNQTNSGAQRVDGVLAQVSGNINNNWKIMTGYSYMNGKIIDSLTSSLIGKPLANVPKHSFSLFTTYAFDSNLQIGGGANYVAQRYAGSSTTGAVIDSVSGTYKRVPGYVVFNAMAKYPLSKKVDLQLNINNLTNRYYFDQIRGNNSAVPGEGRVILLSTNIKF